MQAVKIVGFLLFPLPGLSIVDICSIYKNIEKQINILTIIFRMYDFTSFILNLPIEY